MNVLSLFSRPSAAVLSLLLGACATAPTDYLREAPPEWEQHQASVSAIEDWELRGRLNVRQESANDTVNLVWSQQGSTEAQQFDIRFSGTLGLGATVVRGDNSGIVVEKAGEEPLYLRDLAELSRVYLEFDFPAAHLLYWVRGLPVPTLGATASWTPNARLATLEQTDREGRRWVLDFDRYDEARVPALPGRIRLEQGDLRLTFLVSDWQLQTPSGS